MGLNSLKHPMPADMTPPQVAGPALSHYSRPLPPDAKLGWRAIGFPRMAFVTIVFLCLALFLLIFSAGRMHAQKIMRATPLTPLAVEPLPLSMSIKGKHHTPHDHLGKFALIHKC